MTRTVRCPWCRGSGQVEIITRFRCIEMHACLPCAGSGWLAVVFARKIESAASLG